MDEKGWDRREEDRKAREALHRQLEKLEAKVDEALERLGDDVNEINDYLRGGPTNQDPLGTRVHLVETGLTELRILVKGDSLGRGSLIEMAKEAIHDSEAALKIAHGKAEFQTVRRGQNIPIITSIISGIFLLLSGTLLYWGKIQSVFGKKETPVEWAERIKQDVAEIKKDRGPEVQRKLKEIEKIIKRREGY